MSELRSTSTWKIAYILTFDAIPNEFYSIYQSSPVSCAQKKNNLFTYFPVEASEMPAILSWTVGISDKFLGIKYMVVFERVSEKSEFI